MLALWFSFHKKIQDVPKMRYKTENEDAEHHQTPPHRRNDIFIAP